MNGSTGLLTTLLVAAFLSLVATTAGTTRAQAASSCGVLTASGHTWIVVAKGVTCAKAKNVTRSFAARTAAVRSGQTVIVTSPLLPGFHCVLSSRGKPGGSCATAGAARSILWLVA